MRAIDCPITGTAGMPTSHDPAWHGTIEDACCRFVEQRTEEMYQSPVELWRALAAYGENHEDETGTVIQMHNGPEEFDALLLRAVQAQAMREWQESLK